MNVEEYRKGEATLVAHCPARAYCPLGHVCATVAPGGSAPLFPHQHEVEASWKILDPILSFWETQGQPEPYAPGTWGPQSAHDMLARDGRFWRLP